MGKKISVLAVCDIIIALIIFARINIKGILLKPVTSSASQQVVDSAYTNNNWVVMMALMCVGIVLGVMLMSKTDGILQLIADIVFIGGAGIVMALWWKVLAVTGWGYFCSYQELMAYIGSFMVGTCIIKVVMYFLKRAK